MLVRSRPILLLPLNHTLLFHCFLFHFNILYIIWMVLHLGFTKNCKFQKPQPLDTRNKLTVHKTTYVLCPEGKGTFGIQKHSPNPMKWFRSLSGLGNCSRMYQVHISGPPVKSRICGLSYKSSTAASNLQTWLGVEVT